MKQNRLTRHLIVTTVLISALWCKTEAQTAKMGTDGRYVAVPKGWSSKMGTDGRYAAIPPSGSSKMGTDGRYVAIPKGWSSKMGTDGRYVATPGDAAKLPDDLTFLYCFLIVD
jgi:hypothetical protein